MVPTEQAGSLLAILQVISFTQLFIVLDLHRNLSPFHGMME
jgi:hypothetical protein